MKHILTIILCTASCFCYGQERRQTESREGWWNDNPSFVVPIREIGVTARRPMKEIGVQKPGSTRSCSMRTSPCRWPTC